MERVILSYIDKVKLMYTQARTDEERHRIGICLLCLRQSLENELGKLLDLIREVS